jgi:hypothetical protein
VTAPDADLMPAFIADLGGIWWIESPDAVVLDREWLCENYGPARYGQEEPMPTPADPPQQRRLARDAQGRVGEVMPSPIPEHLRAANASIRLRPEGGGREWWVPADQVTYLERAQ